MLYLLLAILSSATISMTLRLSERYVSSTISTMAVNYAICSVLAMFYTGPARLLPAERGLGVALFLGGVSGVLYLASFIMQHWNISRNGVVLTATFMKLGVLVPTAMSLLFFGESLNFMQVLGFLAALAAILLIQFDGERGKAENRSSLILLLLVGGLTEGMSKVFEYMGTATMKDQYLFYTFVTALVLNIAMIFLKKEKMGKWELLFGAAIGLPNYFCSRFLLLSLDTVPAVIAYPTYSVGAIMAVSFGGLVLFKEKLSRRKMIAIGIVMGALVLLNL